jgi:hypothetical protein
MHARTVLLSAAVGGLLLAQAGASVAAPATSPATTTRLAASFLGHAQGFSSPTAHCGGTGPDPADFLCRFETSATFRNAQVHGVSLGHLLLDTTNARTTGCAEVSGTVTDKVWSNNGHFLGSLIENVDPGSVSCLSKVDGVQTSAGTSTIDSGRGTGIYRHKGGSVVGKSASIRPENPEDLIVVAGTFVATIS